MKSEGALDPRMLPHPKPEPLRFPFRQLVRLSVEHRRHLGLNEVLCAVQTRLIDHVFLVRLAGIEPATFGFEVRQCDCL